MLFFSLFFTRSTALQPRSVQHLRSVFLPTNSSWTILPLRSVVPIPCGQYEPQQATPTPTNGLDGDAPLSASWRLSCSTWCPAPRQFSALWPPTPALWRLIPFMATYPRSSETLSLRACHLLLSLYLKCTLDFFFSRTAFAEPSASVLEVLVTCVVVRTYLLIGICFRLPYVTSPHKFSLLSAFLLYTSLFGPFLPHVHTTGVGMLWC